MRWGDFRRSDNVEDRTGGGGGFGGSGGGLGGGGVRLTGGALVVIVVASLIFGVNPLEMLSVLSGGGGPMPQQQHLPPQSMAPPQPGSQLSGRDEVKEMVARVLGDTEDTWSTIFSKQFNARYSPPRLVLFPGMTQSACGRAVAAVGPFYCPVDRQVYLDTSFFRELDRRFGAPGDFAQAYVIAHEVGHHVQNELGVMSRFEREAQRMDTRGRNAMSVRLELQADCFAGVWGHYAQQRNLLDPGDIEEGLRAAAAVGDDRMQRQAQGTVVPDAFTHGSSQQRMRWFRVGLSTGDPRRCDTFAEL
jgi:predicted metalloprotease